MAMFRSMYSDSSVRSDGFTWYSCTMKGYAVPTTSAVMTRTAVPISDSRHRPETTVHTNRPATITAVTARIADVGMTAFTSV